ncbi:MAG: glycosyltransferase [candidate division WOR-3 bacterium]
MIVAYLWKKNRALAAANGKFLLLTRTCYKNIGGYEQVKDNAIEDVALAKLVKACGYRWRIFDGTNSVSTRMYHSFQEALEGFTKNYFALFGYRILIALFVWFWIAMITFLPLIRIGIGLINMNYNSTFLYSVISVLACWFLWLILAIKFKYPWYQFLLYPLTNGIAIFIGLRSIVFTLTRKTTWKGRRLIHSKIRWL